MSSTLIEKSPSWDRRAVALFVLVVALLFGSGAWLLVANPPGGAESELDRSSDGSLTVPTSADRCSANSPGLQGSTNQPSSSAAGSGNGSSPTNRVAENPANSSEPGQPDVRPRKPAILPPEQAATPVLDAKGRGRATVARAALPPEKRWVGLDPNKDESWDAKKRRVHGLVCELRGGDYVPLAGVIVCDWAMTHRAFTDSQGRFEFDAHFSETKNSRGEIPRNVFLRAIKPGYLCGKLGIGRWYEPPEIDSETGCIITMTRLENISVTVQVANPELIRESLTIWMAFEPHYSHVIGDEWLYVSVEPDETGKAVFSVPPKTFNSIGAYGKGCISNPTSIQRLSENEKEITYQLRLVACDNYKAAGVVKDLRTGKPLASARVAGISYAEVSYTDESGNFCLWLGREPVSVTGERGAPTLKVNCLGYMSVTKRIAGTTPFPDELGLARQTSGGEDAPWEIGLRPWVKAKGLVVIPGQMFPADATLRFAIDPYDMENEYNRNETPVTDFFR